MRDIHGEITHLSENKLKLVEKLAAAIHSGNYEEDCGKCHKELYRTFAQEYLTVIEDDGYRIVPVEPTGEMCEAGIEKVITQACQLSEDCEMTFNVYTCWKAMLDAYPKFTK